MSVPARADLSQDGTQSQVEYIGFTPSPTPGTVSYIDPTNTVVDGTAGFFTVGSGLTLAPDPAVSDTGVVIDPTQITLSNESAFPFCGTLDITAGGGCTDTDDYFDFMFQNTPPVSGVDTADITGVTVDPASAADFLPVSPIDLVSPTEFTVNVYNLHPAVGDKLILDLTFASNSTGPTSVPEPASLVILGAGLIGLTAMRRRRRI